MTGVPVQRPLDANSIQYGLEWAAKTVVLESVDSTSAYLGLLKPDRRHAMVVVANQQTQGRGRRGKPWISPPGHNLYLSMGWSFERPLAEMSCLALAAAVAVCQFLHDAGVDELRLKWPNDLFLPGGKVGGLLTELSAEGQIRSHAIIGLGLNLYLPPMQHPDQPATDLSRFSLLPGREKLICLLASQLRQACEQYQQDGFESFRGQWDRFDLLSGQAVVVSHGGKDLAGTALGINSVGALRVRSDGQVREFYSAEVSVRQKRTE